MNAFDTHPSNLPSALSRLAGRTIGGRYRIDEPIGVGGMGVVFRGEQLRLARDVAVKVLDPRRGGTDYCAERFLREAKSLARLDHVNCLKLYDYGTTDDGLHYMVMPLLRGTSLDQLVGSGETVAPRCAIHLLEQVLSGLEHAHERGLIHRDLKPSNLMIELDGSRLCDGAIVRIVDFGIAKIVDDDAAYHSRSGLLFGTPAYMSPEQVLGQPVDGRSDLFAAGLIIQRLLTGVVPHSARSMVDLCQRRATLDVPPLPERCPMALARLVARLCARRPEDRFPDATSARVELQRVIETLPAEADPRWDQPGPPRRDPVPTTMSERIVTESLTEDTSALESTTWTLEIDEVHSTTTPDITSPGPVPPRSRHRDRWSSQPASSRIAAFASISPISVISLFFVIFVLAALATAG